MSLRFRFPDGELALWLTLGDLTDRSVRVWVRAPGLAAVTVNLHVDGRLVAEATLRPDGDHDDVAAGVLALDRPRPDTPFVVEALGIRRAGRFAPPVGERVPFTFAFGSCHEPFDAAGPEGQLERHAGAAIYAAAKSLLAERDARFALLLGDQVYSDGVSSVSVRKKLAEDESLSDLELVEIYRHLYRGYFNERGFRELCESVPTYLTWDDHDIFDGWGSQLNAVEFDRRLYRAAETAYREYQVLRNPGGTLTDGPAFDYAFRFADVAFFVFDLRGCRAYERGEILGEAQWQRLENFLADADAADTKSVFLAASVPVIHFSPALADLFENLPGGKGTDIRDRWSVTRFHDERERLLGLLFEWQRAAARRQVILLSGDVHVGAAFSARPRAGRGYLHQWTSSALATPSGMQHRLANRLGTQLVRLGERSLRVWKRGLALRNNIGIVHVEPEPEGGHAISLELHEFDVRRATLHRTVTDVARPA